MATWNSMLPQCFQRDGRETTYESVVAEFSPDIGRPIRVRRASDDLRIIGGTMLMTHAQKAIFWDWWKTEAARGLASFTFPDPDDGGAAVTVEFVSSNPPTFRQISPARHSVDLTFRILP
ncbi:MAG: hypothetical protein ACK4U0_19165 [Mesorhizobium sp.]